MKYIDSWSEKERHRHYHTISNPDAPFKQCVAQFGPPRSGTTVVHQILCSLFKETTKTHSHYNQLKQVPDFWVCTIRDPRDVIASYWRVNRNVTTENYEDTKMSNMDIDEFYLKHLRWFHLVSDYHKLANAIFLQYEKYVNNFDYIFDKLENGAHETINISINQDLRKALKHNHSIDRNKQFASKHQYFDQHDAADVSGLHGNHIFSGAHGSWRLLVENEKYMTDKTNSFLKAWNYDE